MKDTVTKPRSPLLILLFSSLGRLYMEYLPRSLRSIERQGAIIANTTHPSATSWRLLLASITKSGISLERYESFSASIAVHLSKAYEDAGWTDSQRHEAERHLLVTGEVPTHLTGVVSRVLSTELDKLLAEDSQGRRHGIAPSRESKLLLQGDEGRQQWDIVRKVTLFAVKELKTCTRCGSTMQNLQAGAGAGTTLPQWIQHTSKYCICGSQWMVI
jgi:hypothetical protein